jgi:hypothetical protein
MKAVKLVVGGAAVMGMIGTFLPWIDVGGAGATGKFAAALPRSGMDNGGVLFLVLLAVPLLAALLGLRKGMGRGLGALALVGGLLSLFMALVKYADIQKAGRLAAKVSADLTISAGAGYWLLFAGSLIALLGGLVALIKPERAVPRGAVTAAAAHA